MTADGSINDEKLREMDADHIPCMHPSNATDVCDQALQIFKCGTAAHDIRPK